MSRVRIPPTLRGETAGAREVEAEGRTVRELLDDLMGRFPALRGQLLAEDDDLARTVGLGAQRRGDSHAAQCPTPAQNST